MQDDLIRRMAPARRLEVARELYDTAWNLKMAVVRREHPEWPDDEVFAKVRRVLSPDMPAPEETTRRLDGAVIGRWAEQFGLADGWSKAGASPILKTIHCSHSVSFFIEVPEVTPYLLFLKAFAHSPPRWPLTTDA